MSDDPLAPSRVPAGYVLVPLPETGPHAEAYWRETAARLAEPFIRETDRLRKQAQRRRERERRDFSAAEAELARLRAGEKSSPKRKNQAQAEHRAAQ